MSKILSFMLPLVLVIIGVQFVRDFFDNTEKDKKAKIEQLVAGGQETIGILNSQYTEKTTKIRRARIKTYEVGYTFKVGEKEFSGTQSLMEPPTEPIVKVRYLPDNPSVNAADPETALASLTEDEGSATTLLMGLGLILGGAGLGFYRYRSLKKPEAA